MALAFSRARSRLHAFASNSYLYSRLRDGNGCAARTKERLRRKIKVDSSRAEMNTLQLSKPYIPHNNGVN